MTNREIVAEEYAKHSCFTEYPNPSLSEDIDISDEIKEAVLYGYNKANEWKYLSKGEYPTEDGSYFVACRSSFEGFDNYTEVCDYKVEQERWINFFGYTNPNVYAWCKLPDPPKEEE